MQTPGAGRLRLYGTGVLRRGQRCVRGGRCTTGKTLWTFPANANWKGSPMAYQFDGKELIGVAAGGSIMAFGLAE